MHVRIVRFTDVTSERMGELKSRLQESDAPPPDSHVKAVKVFVDQEQGASGCRASQRAQAGCQIDQQHA